MKHSSKNSFSLIHAVVWKRVRLEHHSKDLFCHSYLSPLTVFLNTFDQCFTTEKLSQILKCKAASPRPAGGCVSWRGARVCETSITTLDLSLRDLA